MKNLLITMLMLGFVTCCAVTAKAADSDFVRNNGVLGYYQGTGGDIVIPNDVTVISDNAFFGCESLTGVTIPDSVTSIGRAAFSDCINLTSVTIPSSVKSIGELAFRNCTSLTSVTIPEGVTSIGAYAFYGCTNLTSINIPSSVTSIDPAAFAGCNNLSSINSNNQFYQIINGVVFNKAGDTLILYPAGKTDSAYNIPDGVKSISAYAFYGCQSLTTLNIPESVISVGEYAFYDCPMLKQVIMSISARQPVPPATLSVEEMVTIAFGGSPPIPPVIPSPSIPMPSYPTPSPVPSPSNLKKLVIDGTGLRDLPDLTAYTALEELSVINGNWFANVTLPTLPNLKFLAITEGMLKTIDLSNVPGLVELFLYDNQISNIDVSMLTNLETLDIHENNITDISTANGLNSLRYVDVANNLLDLSDASVIKSIDMILATTQTNDGELYYQPQGTPLTPAVLYGDTNKDGTVNTIDLLWLRRYITNGNDPSYPVPCEDDAADVYYDGYIGLDDIITLRRYIVDWYDSLPITPSIIPPIKIKS
ncbi:MAG: leucine-rich repeat protein [Clostridiales bacterium]|jgi:Leucine-rich repeat (LRR) protein|nr:leucine-rich repeat protein [Clostridiales bacterium]